jgi:hypothetical protein
MKMIWPVMIAALAVTGCATKPITYYYGNYSQAYYHSKKDGTPASVAAYKKSLLDIIETSKKKGLRPPPGIYFEYGYLLAKEKSPDAGAYFDLEVQAYPESEKLVAFIESQTKAQ